MTAIAQGRTTNAPTNNGIQGNTNKSRQRRSHKSHGAIIIAGKTKARSPFVMNAKPIMMPAITSHPIRIFPGWCVAATKSATPVAITKPAIGASKIAMVAPTAGSNIVIDAIETSAPSVLESLREVPAMIAPRRAAIPIARAASPPQSAAGSRIAKALCPKISIARAIIQ